MKIRYSVFSFNCVHCMRILVFKAAGLFFGTNFKSHLGLFVRRKRKFTPWVHVFYVFACLYTVGVSFVFL